MFYVMLSIFRVAVDILEYNLTFIKIVPPSSREGYVNEFTRMCSISMQFPHEILTWVKVEPPQ